MSLSIVVELPMWVAQSLFQLVVGLAHLPDRVVACVSPCLANGGFLLPPLGASEIAVLAIFFHVVCYNVVAHTEYNTRFLTTIFGKNAIWFNVGLVGLTSGIRNALINAAIRDDTGDASVGSVTLNAWFTTTLVEIAGWALDSMSHFVGFVLMAGGLLLNLWVLKKLGVIGIYNGDSFGYLFSRPIEDGPYYYFSHPQYVGTAVYWLGLAVYHQSSIGFYLAIVVSVVFLLSSHFVEKPHMAELYSNRCKSLLYFPLLN